MKLNNAYTGRQLSFCSSEKLRFCFLKTLALLFIVFIPFNDDRPSAKQIYIISIDGTINPVAENYIAAGISRAASENAECLIIELNTPGGLLTCTRKIVSAILRSHVPVIVYVAPQGAQAASAGAFIALSASIAAMAPGTNIGAAHPVMMQGAQDSIMMQKATNDAAAFIKTISEKRNRNVKWAEDAVRKSLSITETEAFSSGVIDLIAKDYRELLEKTEGMTVTTSRGQQVLHTANKQIRHIEMTFQQRLLNILSDPNIAYILLILGFYGLLFELYNPGAIFPGAVGFVCLILSFYSLRSLPVNYAGIGLVILAIILFILEIKIISHGLLAVGGTISLVMGSLMLFETDSILEYLFISRYVIIATAIVTILFFLVVIGIGLRAQRLTVRTGAPGMVGEVGRAITAIAPSGQVIVRGEIWSAESTEGGIEKNQPIVVTGVENLCLKVKNKNI